MISLDSELSGGEACQWAGTEATLAVIVILVSSKVEHEVRRNPSRVFDA